VLSLYGNKLSSLHPNLFRDLIQLEELYLTDNELTSLPPNIFEHNTQLVLLGLPENQLSSLPLGIFQGLYHLMDLGLFNNNLTSLHPNIFKGLTELRELELNENQLTFLPDNIFQDLTKMNMLDLRDTQLTSLPSVSKICYIEGRTEIMKRQKDKEKHQRNWKYVGVELECFSPTSISYAHLPVFSRTFFGRVGGVDYLRVMDELDEFKKEMEGFLI